MQLRSLSRRGRVWRDRAGRRGSRLALAALDALWCLCQRLERRDRGRRLRSALLDASTRAFYALDNVLGSRGRLGCGLRLGLRRLHLARRGAEDERARLADQRVGVGEFRAVLLEEVDGLREGSERGCGRCGRGTSGGALLLLAGLRL